MSADGGRECRRWWCSWDGASADCGVERDDGYLSGDGSRGARWRRSFFIRRATSLRGSVPCSMEPGAPRECARASWWALAPLWGVASPQTVAMSSKVGDRSMLTTSNISACALFTTSGTPTYLRRIGRARATCGGSGRCDSACYWTNYCTRRGSLTRFNTGAYTIRGPYAAACRRTMRGALQGRLP